MHSLKVHLLDSRASLPEKGTEGSACYDLRVILDEPFLLKAHTFHLFHTGLAIELPSHDYVAMLYSRSGMGVKHGITLTNSVGVIDSDYRGEVCVSLINQSDEDYLVQPGDRIAQLMISPVCSLPIEVVSQLTDSDRGQGGFGSTGKD